ncbi:hypothetical protein DWB68_12845 [Galactobacter valiniphilus]|uniref:TetR/AcrR family transcriptional regulator n=1 Tax=Galactobacter valiniphilus TaxID=2676122 RepID=A0A399J7A7_9MICC|nr:hypothetical protein [Galactobacter valiniphilus]RII41403.1 hypothetical protein DWB68_12845 [Galactobacter valiniphilus]
MPTSPAATASDIPAPLDLPLGAASTSRVLRTAGALFAGRGLGNVSLELLAEESGTPLDALRAQYPTIESALAVSLAFMNVGLQDAGFKGQRPRGWASFDAFTATLSRGMNTPGLYQLYSDVNVAAVDPKHPAHDWLVQHHDFILEHMRVSIATGIEDGQIRAEADPEELHRQLTVFLLGVVPAWRVLGERFSLEQAFLEFKELMVRRFATPGYLASRAA